MGAIQGRSRLTHAIVALVAPGIGISDIGRANITVVDLRPFAEIGRDVHRVTSGLESRDIESELAWAQPAGVDQADRQRRTEHPFLVPSADVGRRFAACFSEVARYVNVVA